MLYFDDFMEAIENLPDELNESLSTVRQLDLLMQNTLEPLAERKRSLFESCKYNRIPECEKMAQYAELVQNFEKALVYCQEKKAIVDKLYSMYKNLMRKLDTELEKFRLELEADNSGITEQIEKKVNSVLGKSPCNGIKQDKRRQRLRYQQTSHYKNPYLVHRRIVGQACRTVLKSSATRPAKLESYAPGGVRGVRKSLNTNQFGSRKLSAAYDVVKQEEVPVSTRRFRSMDYGAELADSLGSDVAFDAKSFGGHNLNFSIKSSAADDGSESGVSVAKSSPFPELGTEYHANLVAERRPRRLSSVGSHEAETPDTRITSPLVWPHVPASASRRQRRRRADTSLDEHNLDSNVDHFAFGGSCASSTHESDTAVFEPSAFTTLLPDPAMDDEDQKRYCICNDISYGDMIACDNPACSYEWFHYGCVNLTVAPKGNWYCPACMKSQMTTCKLGRKRGGRR